MTLRRGTVALLTAALFVSTPALADPNLLANPGFEDNGGSYDGWTILFGNGIQMSTPATDDVARTGDAAAKAFGEFNNCPDAPQFDVGGFGQSFTPVAGMEYELSGWGRIESNDPIPGSSVCDSNRLIAKIVYFDAASGGNELQANEVIVGGVGTPLNSWVPFSVVAPAAPAGALRVEALFLFLQPGCDEGSVFVDDTSFCERTPETIPNQLANPSFDTSLAGWATFGNVFHEARGFMVHSEPGCAKLFSTFVPESSSGMFQSFAAAPGTVWRLNAYALHTCREDNFTIGNYVLARIVFRNSMGDEIGSSEEILADNMSSLGEWVQTDIRGVAPPNTVAAEAFVLFISPECDGSPETCEGAVWVDDVSFAQISTSGVGQASSIVNAKLHQNAPNPFNPTTRIRFELIDADAVALGIFDVSGRRVTNLVDGALEAGVYEVSWDGRTAAGTQAATGIYHYVLETSKGKISRRMVLNK